MSKEPKKQSGSGQRTKTRQLEAQAKTAQANAEAAKAQAEAARIAAELEAKKLEAQASKQKVDAAITVATYGAGIAAGYKISGGIDRKIAESIGEKNKALNSLASETTKLANAAGGTSDAGKRATAKLAATVKTADKVGITRTGRGKAGLITVAGLATMGIATRTLASGQEDPTSKALYDALGTAEIAAAGTVAYNEAKAASAPKVLPDVKSLAAIEQGRAIAEKGMPAAPAKPVKTPSPVTKAKVPALPGAGKAKAASKTMVSGMTQAGTAAAAGKTVAKAGLRTLGPVAIAAATVAAITGSAQAGENTAQNIAKGATAAVDAALFGLPGMVRDAVKSKETIGYDPKEAARQANLASAEKKMASGAKLTRAEEIAVQEKRGEILDTPVTARDISMAAGVGSGVALLTAGMRASMGQSSRPGIVIGAGLAAISYFAGKAASEDKGKAYLNDAAKSKAEAAPAMTPAAAGRLAAQVMTADGQTESYQRRTRTGKTVTVQGYRTPTR